MGGGYIMKLKKYLKATEYTPNKLKKIQKKIKDDYDKHISLHKWYGDKPDYMNKSVFR